MFRFYDLRLDYNLTQGYYFNAKNVENVWFLKELFKDFSTSY